jgi:hypothetical protein
MAPTARFIGGYANWRLNPFTAADMAVDKTEDHVAIPASSPYLLQLLEVPRKNSPSSVVIYNYSDGITMAEVAHAVTPTQGQYAVDYPAPDGSGTGLVRFHSNDAGKDIRVTYKATGSPVVSEFLDTFVPWPSSTPGENQVVGFKSGVPTWMYNPVRMFHSENVAYNAAGEDESCLVFDFKKGANESLVFLRLKGAKLWQGFYTEVGGHLHAKGTIATGEGGGHAHSVDPHTHAHGTLGQPLHYHAYTAPAEGSGHQENTVTNGDQAITGATAGQGSSTSSVGDHSHPVTGSTALYSPVVKTYPDSLKIYIDNVDRTANILALSGLAKLGDGTVGHAFITGGTGEMDITSILGAGASGFHEIRVTEPTAAKGGRCLLNLELY